MVEGFARLGGRVIARARLDATEGTPTTARAALLRARRARKADSLARQGVLFGVALDRGTPIRRRMLDAASTLFADLREKARVRAEARRSAWRAPEQTDIFTWLEARRAEARPQPLLRITNGGRGGPDPSRPCVGCAMAPKCRAPCALLANMIPVEETENRNEVRSTVLSEPGRQDGGRDVQFLTIPTEWADDLNNHHGRDGGPGVWQVIVDRYGGERLLAAIHSPVVLTAKQRSVLLQWLAGKDRTEIRVARHTSRQSVHKIFHAALQRLRRHFGELPDRADLLDDLDDDA